MHEHVTICPSGNRKRHVMTGSLSRWTGHRRGRWCVHAGKTSTSIEMEAARSTHIITLIRRSVLSFLGTHLGTCSASVEGVKVMNNQYRRCIVRRNGRVDTCGRTHECFEDVLETKFAGLCQLVDCCDSSPLFQQFFSSFVAEPGRYDMKLDFRRFPVRNSDQRNGNGTTKRVHGRNPPAPPP